MNIVNVSFKTVLETMDYVPVVSTFKNLGDIFAKAVWKPDLEALSVHAKTYYEHIVDKSYLRCVLLLIPVVGNLFVWVIDLEKETEAQATGKIEALLVDIETDIRLALHGGLSISGRGSSDDLVFNETFSYEIMIKKRDVMKDDNGQLQVDEEGLKIQMLGIEAAVAELHQRFGKEALNCFHVLGKDDQVIVSFPSVPKGNVLRMVQIGPHNHPAIAASSQILTVE